MGGLLFSPEHVCFIMILLELLYYSFCGPEYFIIGLTYFIHLLIYLSFHCRYFERFGGISFVSIVCLLIGRPVAGGLSRPMVGSLMQIDENLINFNEF